MSNDLIEIQAQDLEGKALDWAAAKAIGLRTGEIEGSPGSTGVQMPDGRIKYISKGTALDWIQHGVWQPSTDWAQGGAIIDACNISINNLPGRAKHLKHQALMDSDFKDKMGLSQIADGWGPTHLVAAMRCVVHAKLGPTISVPAKLLPAKPAATQTGLQP